MRLIELALDGYGPFRDLRLQFDPQAKVHIVYGANEAGKSSALLALSDLFYGAPRRGDTAFLRQKDLRLGATLRGRNGQILQFTRRRGDKNVLFDASGAALPDDSLAPFLGAATRDIFHRAFGLDAAALRAGGDEMLRAEGEIGASLFAAASGLRGLLDLRAGLEREAEGIFDKKAAGHRSFYIALGRFDAARKQEKAAMLSESTLKALKAGIAEAEEKIAAHDQEESRAQAEKIRLERLRKASPVLKNLAGLRARFAAFDCLAAFLPDWARQLTAHLEAHKAASEQATQALKIREGARLELEAAHGHAELLAQADKIEDLIRLSGAYEDQIGVLPRRETVAREARQLLVQRAQSCGLAGLEPLRASLPDAAALSRAEKCVARGREIFAGKLEPQRALAEEEGRLALLGALQAPQLDAADLREKLLAFGSVANWDESFRETARLCADEARVLQEKCARLHPSLENLENFARNPSPDAAAIEQATRLFEDVEARENAARRKAEEAGDGLVAARARLRALERLGPIASLDALRAARESRDAAWRFLRAILKNETLADSARADENVEKFETLSTEADQRADGLLTDAARVAAAEAERANIAAAQAEQERAEATRAELAREREQKQAEWERDWLMSGIHPAQPRKMMVWRRDADALLEAREALARQQAKSEAWRQKLAEAQPGLEALAAESGLAPLPLSAAALAGRIERQIGEIAKAQDAAREARAKIADAPVRIARWKQRLEALATEEALWREQWRAALQSLRLDEDTSFDEAQARIALWRALPGELADEEEKAQRVTAIAKDIAGFERGLDALLVACARDIPARPAIAAVAHLRKRLTLAREKAALRAQAERRLHQAEEAARQAQDQYARAQADLQGFCAASNFVGDPEALAARLAQREAGAGAIQAEAARLALVADGFEESVLAREAENFDPDAAQIRLAEIERQSEARKIEAREIHAGLRAGESKWEALQTEAGAETAIQARENARAEIVQESRRWAVLKLAALLVDSGLGRHRDRRKDPLIARAGALFSTLTESRYAGLDQNFGEDDQLHLRARRADGAELELTALSEGARDQLYLALRLAFLEDYAARSEAPPFIGDDLFASFDDSRLSAGLHVLEQASAAIQPIIFTHHAHIVRLARDRLGDAAQILRLD